jgi:Leu/Phe-tRNA-protein transferase
MHLASVMLEDEAIKETLKDHQFEVSLNTKFQLIIKNVPKEVEQ